MKDASIQKVKSVPSCPADSSEASVKLPKNDTEGSTMSSEGQVRVRKSAAMIGLALSMGATGMLLPGHEDQAMATESVNPESALTSLPNQVGIKKDLLQQKVSVKPTPVKANSLTPKPIEPAPPVIKHKVKKGENLWKLSKNYAVEPKAIAASNKIKTQSTLSVGQTLKIPSVNKNNIVHEAKGKNDTVTPTPLSSRVKTNQIENAAPLSLSRKSQLDKSVAVTNKTESLLQNEQNIALNNLQQKRERLEQSLAKLRAEKSNNSQTETIAVSAPESVAIPVPLATLPEENSPQVAPITNSYARVSQEKTAVIPLSSPETTAVPPSDKQKQLITEVQKTTAINSPLPETPSNPISGRQKQLIAEVNEPIPITVPLPETVVSPISEPQNDVTTPSEVNIQIQPIEEETTIGQLNLPQPVVLATSSNKSYQVRPGDTINSIARRYGVSRSELVRVNNINNPNLIKVNQELTIPGNPVSRNTNQPRTLIPNLPLPVSNSNSQNQINNSYNPLGNSRDSQAHDNPYIAKMKSEILRMREEPANPRENTQEVSSTAGFNRPIPIPVSSPPEPINPEWREKDRPRQAPIRTPIEISAAPVDPGTYNRTFRTPVGEEVSPQLPPLSPAEQYLPNSPARFNGYIWPAKGVLTSGYGRRWGRMHKGIDIAAPIGTPIVAAAPGEVVSAGWNSGGYGNLVKVQHSDGSLTLYAHNNRILVRRGQKVDQGQQIAEMGSTGYSTGPHLHFEVHPNGRSAANPVAYLPKKR